MAKNSNLSKAKTAKNDEFYTQLSDVEKELKHYKEHFKDKIVFCNCDDPEWSAFWKYFHLNFNHLGLKKLISTHYVKEVNTENTLFNINPDVFSYKMEYTGENDEDISVGVKTKLKGNGDFRSNECVELLKECDVVVTNPPFSMFREYVAQLVEYDKKFLIIGNMNCVTYKEIFPLIRDNRMWVGANERGGTRKGNSLCFTVPDSFTGKTIDVDGVPMAQVSAWWFTNLDFAKRHQKYIFWCDYDVIDNPKFDNYDAIECGHSDKYPKDYYDEVGVPISFLNGFYNPDEFEIITMSTMSGKSANYWSFIDGKSKYSRIFIRRKKGSK